MPPVRMRGDGRKARNPKKTLSRLLSYMKQYRTTMIVVIVCILLSAVAQVAASKSLQYVVDDYIAPMLGEQPGFRAPHPLFVPHGLCVCHWHGVLLPV